MELVMDQDKERLISTIMEIYGRLVWTHKTHEKDRELNTNRANRDKWINAFLIASTTVALATGLVLDENLSTYLGIFLAFISTLFAVYSISFAPSNEADLHRQTAKALIVEREKLLLLLEKAYSSNADLEEIRKELERATTRITQIYSIAPNTSSKAFGQASKALNVNEELTFSDGELNRILPPGLRKPDPSPNKP
jgi:hypothetical protein